MTYDTDMHPEILRLQLSEEELLVAELEYLNIGYLSRQSHYRAEQARPAQRLFADLLRQPNSRVRTASIALLLAHPEFAPAIPECAETLPLAMRQTLKLFYTAAVLLQRVYASRLRPFMGGTWQWLPDYFSKELELEENEDARQQLKELERIHQKRTGVVLNWSGTYENVAQHLIRRWELERTWKL